ncbi:MAG: M67 family metallopeptidase [Planctomycetota bacterium]|nr:M67 family metallopeptidase [Planctomycetota bacterium]MCX8039975.1 M67 family metallopeptidase [Planctomycetota bacterium]MDW8372957.1 M67 family metallopeptidase [Planctomycetota bacterium]
MLSFSPAAVEAIVQHASAGYPSETCGLLFGDREERCTRAVVVPNEADRYHAADPIAYPRTSRDYFLMNGAKVGKLVREAEAQGERWLGIWHSHIDCGAYFSSEDARTFAPDGVPTWPDLYQLVVDVRAHRIIEARAFRWDGRCFAPVATFPEFARAR